MSCIGEYRGFRRTADELRHRLATETLTDDARAELLRQAEECDQEAKWCWQAAAEEAKWEADDRGTGPEREE